MRINIFWKAGLVSLAALGLAACGTTSGKRQAGSAASAVKPVRINPAMQADGGRELIMQSMDLVGTPYRWGGTTDAGFDCSGMIQYLYKNALGVNLPRTSRDMAAASKRISKSNLKAGDLVFFNTSGRGISHVGLYIGNDQFIHAPSSGKVIQTEKLSKPYYASRLVKAGTYFY
ncbi:C40 family peptidase [Neisseria dentiae]|uniref:C40 family peptidase n=1 Tax=Neisseria dentiae TaxID=194197 RepID=UPI00359F87E2